MTSGAVKRKQCPKALFTSTGLVFCVKQKGHRGDHRGSRAQWNAKGRVPITEKLS